MASGSHTMFQAQMLQGSENRASGHEELHGAGCFDLNRGTIAAVVRASEDLIAFLFFFDPSMTHDRVIMCARLPMHDRRPR